MICSVAFLCLRRLVDPDSAFLLQIVPCMWVTGGLCLCVKVKITELSWRVQCGLLSTQFSAHSAQVFSISDLFLHGKPCRCLLYSPQGFLIVMLEDTLWPRYHSQALHKASLCSLWTWQCCRTHQAQHFQLGCWELLGGHLQVDGGQWAGNPTGTTLLVSRGGTEWLPVQSQSIYLSFWVLAVHSCCLLSNPFSHAFSLLKSRSLSGIMCFFSAFPRAPKSFLRCSWKAFHSA